jgi:arsenite-transporting ATPase
MRIILFTGKGGTGKTTLAAATALQSAQSGLRTLILSTDPAHSLSDALQVDLGPEPEEIAENLFAQELDVYYSMKKYWGNMRQLMLSVFKWQGMESVRAEEMSALPGMEEASAFLWMEKYHSEDDYDVLIIDSAPTGETLTLLTLPQVTKWWVSKAFPMQKVAIKGIGRALRATTGVPLDKGYDELLKIFDKLEKIQKVFADPEQASIRIVANPEKMVIAEAKRAFGYLQMYGYHVDAVAVNRILPEAEVGSAFSKYVQNQKTYLEEIEWAFQPMPILKCFHQGQEVFGKELLQKIANELYPEGNAADILFQGKQMEYEETENGYVLKIHLPFLETEHFDIQKIGDEIVLNWANQRRHILLPRFVHFMQAGEWSYKDNWLHFELLKVDDK